jgi:hypothetical protein
MERAAALATEAVRASSLAVPKVGRGSIMNAMRRKVFYAPALGRAVARGNWAKMATAEDWTFRSFMDTIGELTQSEVMHVSSRTLGREADKAAREDFEKVKAFVHSHMLLR